MAVAATPGVGSRCGPAAQAAAWSSGSASKLRNEAPSYVTIVRATATTPQGFLCSSRSPGLKIVSHIDSLPRLASLRADSNVGHGFGCCRPHQLKNRRRRKASVRCAQASDPDLGTVAETSQQNRQPGSSKFVLVFGAGGGVGQLLVASLLDKGVRVRAIVRNAEKATSLFGDKFGEQLEFRVRDTREPEAIDGSVVDGVTHVIIATGTTAFPSKRWFGNNGPEQTDLVGKRNIIDALPRTVQKVIMVSSIGVTRYDRLPFNILNLFGVLKYKKMAEDYLRASGIPFTIIRPTQLTGAPYTAYDMSTLMKRTSGSRTGVLIGQGDEMLGNVDRGIVAEACVQALDLQITTGKAYEVGSVEGAAPGKETEKWRLLFEKASTPAFQKA